MYHIGFYSTGPGIAAFKKEIAKYKNSKGAGQFPFEKAFPVLLIAKLVKFKVAANAQNAEIKKALKKNKIKSAKKNNEY